MPQAHCLYAPEMSGKTPETELRVKKTIQKSIIQDEVGPAHRRLGIERNWSETLPRSVLYIGCFQTRFLALKRPNLSLICRRVL